MGKFAFRPERTVGTPEHKERWNDVMYRKVNNDQYKFIKRRHGEKAAKEANYGWGDGGDDERISYATKIYSNKEPRIIESEVTYPNTRVSHDWEEYGSGSASDRLAGAIAKGLKKHVEDTKVNKTPIKRKPDWQK